MYRISRVYLVFLGAALQAVTVEAKGGKGGKSGGSGGGGSGGGTIGGVTVGVIAAAVILYAMVLKYRPYVMKCLRRSPPRGGKLQANRASKDPDFERNAVEGYPPQDIPVYSTSPPPPVQYNQMDWKRDSGPIPPQIYPGPPSFPPTPYMGAAYTPSQYSPTQSFPMPHPMPMPHSPPMQHSPAMLHSPLQPVPAYSR